MYRSVEWMLLDATASQPVAVGDLVSVDAGGMPVYRVTQVQGQTVRVVPADGGQAAPRDARVSQFQWRGVLRVAAAA